MYTEHMIINLWHSVLDMPKHDLEWHKQDIRDELEELEEAKGLIYHWSEMSDVVYTYTRAKWSGHKDIKWPLNRFFFPIGLVYMFPKYTLRWAFFRKLGNKMNSEKKLTEVRNPKKVEKLGDIARRYNLDEEKFKEEASRLMRYWMFLK